MSSKIVAVVSASVLAGGGAGMLAGVALGAINPFALGIIGVVLGIGASVPLTSLIVARKAPRRPWWRRLFGAEQKVRLDRNVDEVREEPFRHREVAEGQREHDRIDSEQAGGGKRTARRPRGCRTTSRRAEKTTGGAEERRKRPCLRWVEEVRGPR
jgi:hypothetical protein